MECTHIRLMVEKFNECFRFYRDVIGLATTYPEDSAGPYAEFVLGGDKFLGLFNRSLMQDALDDSPSPLPMKSDDRVVLCFAVEDVDAHASKLQADGVAVVVPPRDHEPWGMRTTYVRDPAGNLLEFYGPLTTARG